MADKVGTSFEIGAVVRIESSRWPLYGVVQGLRQGKRDADMPLLDVSLLGEISLVQGQPRFVRGVSRHPALGGRVLPAEADEEALIYRVSESQALTIGHHRHAPAVPARLMIDRLLGNHFAILGSTGSGKSCAVTVLLNAVTDLCPSARIVVIDPHNEYTTAFQDRCIRFDTSNLDLPFWMMNFEEIAAILTPGHDRQSVLERSILKRAIYSARLAFVQEGQHGTAVSVDTPVPYRLSRLVETIEDEMGALNKPDGTSAYRQLLDRIELLRSDPRYKFLMGSLVTRDNMTSVIGALLRIPTDGKPLSVVDISGVPSEIADIVVSFLCRLIFEVGLWSERDHSAPILLLCEEAHRYVPSDAQGTFGPSRRAIDRIAKEGRKYGIALGLVSQRPSELSTSSLSQCGTLIALRMSNERDQNFIRDTTPEGSAWVVDRLPALATGEAVILGEATNIPQQCVLHRLPQSAMPSCATPSFIEQWSKSQEEVDHASLSRTIDRWRGKVQTETFPPKIEQQDDAPEPNRRKMPWET